MDNIKIGETLRVRGTEIKGVMHNSDYEKELAESLKTLSGHGK